MRTTPRFVAAVIAAGGIATALLAAPLAAAEPANPALPQCVDTGGAQAIGGSTTECATPGNVSIDSTPSDDEFTGPWGDMWGGDGFFIP